MSGKFRYRKSTNKLQVTKQDEVTKIPGELGLKLGGNKLVEVPNRPGFVYVRLRNDQSEVVQAYNDKVSLVYGLPVVVVRDRIDKGRYYIDGRDTGRYNNWGASSYLPIHGSTHSFNPAQPGADITWVWDRQFTPLLTVPSGTAGGLGVTIYPGTLYYNDVWKYIGFTGTASLAGYKPTDGTARMVLVSVDTNGNPVLTPGGTFSPLLSGSSEVYPYIPSIPSSSVMAISAIRLVSGTTVLTWDNIYDLRQFTTPMTTGTRGHKILDDTVVMPQRSNLAFAGNQFLLFDDSGNDRTVVSGTYPVGANGHTIQSNLSTMTNRSRLRFSGPSFLVYDDSGGDVTIVSGSPAFNNSVFFSGSLTFQEEGVSVTQRDTINFVGASLTVYDDPINLKTIVSGTASGGSNNITIWNRNIPPASPNSLDDEFNDNAVGAQWTEADYANYVVFTENSNGLNVEVSNVGTGTAYAALYISITGTAYPWTAVLGLEGLQVEGFGNGKVGLGIGNNFATTGTSMQWLIAGSSNGYTLNRDVVTGTSIRNNVAQGSVGLAAGSCLLRIRGVTSGSFFCDLSTDGRSWSNITRNSNPGFALRHLGIIFEKDNSGATVESARAMIRFFRFYNNNNYSGTVGGYMTIGYS